MIQATELRIGNFIRCLDIETEIWCVDKVALLTASQIITEDESRGGAPANEKYEGLPLTEEWLLRLGFRKLDFENCFSILVKPFDFRIEILPNENFVIVAIGNVSRFHAPCEYVHQLQNLFFALTGEELKIESHASV